MISWLYTWKASQDLFCLSGCYHKFVIHFAAQYFFVRAAAVPEKKQPLTYTRTALHLAPFVLAYLYCGREIHPILQTLYTGISPVLYNLLASVGVPLCSPHPSPQDGPKLKFQGILWWILYLPTIKQDMFWGTMYTRQLMEV